MAYARRATIHDAFDMAERLRPEDRAEIAAGSGERPEVSLVRSLLASENPQAIIFEDRVIGLFGVSPLGNGVGAPWMMATPELPKVAFQFLREGRGIIEGWRKEYRLLFNTVDARNEVHIRWLKWLGFQFVRLIPEHGVERRPFFEFVMIGEYHV